MKRFVLAAALTLATVAGLLLVVVSREPTYDGRTLDEWLPEVRFQSPFDLDYRKDQKAREAVRALGTNALPYLLRRLNAKDSLMKIKLMALVQKQSLVKIRWKTARQRRREAMLGIRALGTNAAPAAPLLLKFLDSPDQGEAWVAYSVFSDMGTAAEKGLTRALTNRNPIIRSTAPGMLSKFEINTPSALRGLENALHDTNSEVRVAATQAVRKLTGLPEPFPLSIVTNRAVQ